MTSTKSLIVMLILSMSLVIAGCGGDKSKNSEKTFVYGTMAYGIAMENVGTDPHKSYSGWSTIRYGIGETLFKFNEKMELVPWIAESFEQVDEYTLKIKINDKATFSNGKKVTGEAVKACLDDLIAHHDRAPHDLKIDNITAEGQFVTIKSKEKTPSLLNYLSDPYGCIVDVSEGVKDDIVVGTGPYKAVKVTETEIELVKNENYWGEVKPKIDKIIVKSITDGDTLTMAMQNGELDAAQGLPYSSIELFKDSSKFKISSNETSRVYQMAFSFKNEDLRDIRVRRAISMAIDRDGFTKVLLKGNGASAVGPFPTNLAFGNNAVKAAPFDAEGAKKLLAEAGYKDTNGDGYVDKNGKNLSLKYLTYTSRQELPLMAEYAEDALKKIGVKLDLNVTDNYKAVLKRGEYDIFAKAIVTAPTGDPEYYFSSHIVKGAVDNAGFYESPEVVSLLSELHNTYGADKRAALGIKLSQRVLDDAALFYMSHLRMSFVMKPNVEGFTAHPSDYYEIRPELDK